MATLAASLDMRLHLGAPEIRNLGKCADGNCIGIYVEVPAPYHITGIRKEGSDFVHPCNETTNCGHKEAWRYVEGSPHNKAEWLGWTNSGDRAQEFILHIEYQ
jgi:hypothetical protein